ncbi:OB-fold domain-containing protein [Xanthobacter sp. DSM 24535]|uniref:Zn-ribbon domain-containing OB-fold protein n=1 Tax=Roseixanthobacter psychrophilus TaxID=3119917 RepID=UPI00372C2F6A
MNALDERQFAGPGPEQVFRAGLADGKFLIQRCTACATHVFYPRALCPACDGGPLECVEASGAGEVYSSTIIRQPADKGGDYNLAMVTLAEGPRLMTQVVGIAPQDVRIGLAVRATIRKAGEAPAIFFEPV